MSCRVHLFSKHTFEHTVIGHIICLTMLFLLQVLRSLDLQCDIPKVYSTVVKDQEYTEFSKKNVMYIPWAGHTGKWSES